MASQDDMIVHDREIFRKIIFTGNKKEKKRRIYEKKAKFFYTICKYINVEYKM